VLYKPFNRSVYHVNTCPAEKVVQTKIRIKTTKQVHEYHKNKQSVSKSMYGSCHPNVSKTNRKRLFI